MPSRNELAAIGEGRLGSQVARTLGFVGWARRLRLPLKWTETHRGEMWERREASFFRSLGGAVKRHTTRHPFDLTVNGSRVDVKSATWTDCTRAGDGKHVRGFVSAGLKRGATCDVFDLVCTAANVLVARYVVPASEARVTTLTITQKTLNGSGRYSAWLNAVHVLGLESGLDRQTTLAWAQA